MLLPGVLRGRYVTIIVKTVEGRFIVKIVADRRKSAGIKTLYSVKNRVLLGIGIYTPRLKLNIFLICEF
jgi:hypothetical protein